MKANQRTVQPARKRLQSLCASLGRVLNIQDLPDDVMDRIFSKLKFKNKICVGLVCKQWDRLLKAGTGALRHWVVDYNLDTCVSKGSDPSRSVRQLESSCRWLINRAAAIKHVRVTATLTSDEQGDATRTFLDSQMLLLADSLSKSGATLDLKFHYGSPFGSSPLSSSAFLTCLCPLVKRLSLCDMTTAISATQFAAICELSGLVYLSISGADDYDDRSKDGLQEITADISNLVNLKTLALQRNGALEELPIAFTTLANLTCLCIVNNGGIRLARSLQGLESLTTVAVTDCWLKAIPEALTGLANLTSLDVSENNFHSGQWERRQWWPPTLSRLSKLADLVLFKCRIGDIPSDISALQELTRLQIGQNRIRHLPWEFSSLQKLRQLWANCNRFSTVPIYVLSSMAALTRISFPLQGYCEEGESYDFEDYFPSDSDVEFYESGSDDVEEEEVDDQYSGGSPLSVPSTPVSLDLNWNSFDRKRNSCGVWSMRWPTDLSRLTGLVELDMSRCDIGSLPSDMSRLWQLTKLDLSNNELTCLPEGMSRLRTLKNLVMDDNSFPAVPVSVLSSLTALTKISIRDQTFKQPSTTFKVSSSLLPILHPGLVKLDLSQTKQWDPLSLSHIQHAMGAVAIMTPMPAVEFLPRGG